MKKLLMVLLLCLNIQMAQANPIKYISGLVSVSSFASSMVSSKKCLSQNGDFGFTNASNCQVELLTTGLTFLTTLCLSIIIMKSILSEKKAKKAMRVIRQQELTTRLHTNISDNGTIEL